jgi:hypothetical protein
MILFLGLAGMCLNAGFLGAADLTGSFTLPIQTHWGSAVLPAGHYTFTLDDATLNGHIRVTQGTDPVATVMAQGMSTTGFSGASSMLIGGDRVRSLHLAPVGLTYEYAIPRKEKREILARRSGVPDVAVSVTAK